MSLPTMPRLPRIGRWRDALRVSEDTPPGAAALDRERASSGATDALDTRDEAPAVVVETDEMRKQRMRRMATIIAASLIVSAIASGAATVIARRMRNQRARASGAQPGQG